MPVSGVVPDWLFSVVAAATVFAVMFDLGLAMVPGDLRWTLRRRAQLFKGLFAVLVAVPLISWLLAGTFALPRAAAIGIVLMAISPGVPVAMRRLLGAGGHRSFAPALQIAVAALAVVSMPSSIAAFNEYYGGHASIATQHLARQVFAAQFLPLGLGMLVRRAQPQVAAWLEPRLRRAGGVLLVLLLAPTHRGARSRTQRTNMMLSQQRRGVVRPWASGNRERR